MRGLCMPVSCGFTCTLGSGCMKGTLVPARYCLVISDFGGSVGAFLGTQTQGLAVGHLSCSISVHCRESMACCRWVTSLAMAGPRRLWDHSLRLHGCRL